MHACRSACLFVFFFFSFICRSLKTCHLTNLHLDYNRYEYDMTCIYLLVTDPPLAIFR